MDEAAKARLGDLMETLRRSPGACTMCGRSTRDVGLFFPNDSQKFGALPGKQRVIAYRVCPRCSAVPGFKESIENVFLRDVERGKKLRQVM